MKQLKFIQACPDDNYYLWQVHLWLESLREIGHSDKAISLIYTPAYREFNDKWDRITKLYPESEFVFYKDEGDLSKYLGIYIPILRPYCLMRYFNENPSMKEHAVFYCDADVVFTEKFDISKYIEDDIVYLSDTKSYINATYFDSKVKDVLPDKLEQYKKIDVLAETAGISGITREICERNNENSGGAQYLLKNVDGKFWEKVLIDCIKIRVHLQSINKEYFENENKGFQSWCSDMWAVLWNLWYRNIETKIVPEMDFAWSSDPILKIDKVGIMHNAGIVSDMQGDIPVFYKGKYHQGKDPFGESYIYRIYKDEKNKALCNHFYVTKMVKLKEKYNVNYE